MSRSISGKRCPEGTELSFSRVAAATRSPSLCMEAALNGIANSKHSATKEAVAQAREALKNQKEKGDVPIAYVREKCLAAIELAFDHGNEKCSHAAVEGVQTLLRDQRFQSACSEKAEQNLPTQILHSMTGIEQWNAQLQCHCLTLLVEMICSSELKISLPEVEETLELCMRVYGGSREESVRVSARAAVSQSITSYFGNRYGSAEEPQEQIAVFFDVTKLLEAYVAKLDQLTTSNDQSVVVFDATNALLSSQPLSIQRHQPFVNLLWEKLCPLMIRLLGVPDKNVTSSSVSVSTEEPMGQGQINKFPLSPAVISNPEATRALYSILEQLIRIMAGISSVSSVLEALFHKAFLFPKIEQRTEAVRVIRKIVACPKRIADLVAAATRSKSLSLWRMLIVCLLESANPSYEISIDAVRSCGAMLQGVLDFSRSTQLLDAESRRILGEMFSSLPNATVTSFTARSDVGSCSPRPSTDSQPTPVKKVTEEEVEDEMSQTLKRLTAKFGMERQQSEDEIAHPIFHRRSTEYDETSEKVTAQKFADALSDKLPEWAGLRSTLAVDEAILEFSAAFYSNFSAVHNEVFKCKSKVQQEFLNTDAIYLTAHAALSLCLRGSDRITASKFKESILSSGCIVYVSDSWLQKVYDHVAPDSPKEGITGALKDVISDYDGLDKRLLSDWQRLQRISRGSQSDLHPYEERLAARWLITSAWDSIVHILSTFLGVKERRRARPKVLQGAEHAINGVQKLATVALELELGDRCGWIFENLVEASCDVEELRTTATTEEQKRWSIVSRLDLLSIQMVLDNAFVGVHAAECWKHVIRCTEFVWELEKYIYGALCYEKPSRFSFGKKKKEPVENKAEEGLSCADRSVEVAIGDKELDKDSMNKALAVLIAKVDRFYSECGRKLCLRSLRELCVALVGASENRILYSNHKAPALAPAVNLIVRLSETLTPMPNRPLVHQMFIWPIVGAHFIQIAPCGEESRSAVEALSEAAASMLVAESNGMCFNQMLLAPFQAIVCSDSCSPETREQLVSALSDYVKIKFDTLGSGWKPLFGTLRAVRTSTVENASVHWTVLDVIGSYLRIRRSSVLSWSLPDCLPCIIHFLQSTEAEASEIDEQLSEAALHLVQPTYSVILNLLQTPHIPNQNLLHRADLRSASEEEVESRIVCQESTSSWLPPLSAGLDPAFYGHDETAEAAELDQILEVPRGSLPWKDLEAHAIASTELLLSFVDQLAGALVTAPPKVQPPLLNHIQTLITSMRQGDFGVDTTAFCVSALVLPMAQKWLRRGNHPDEGRNLKQAIGACTQIVLEIIDGVETSEWSTRLLSDICRLTVECCAQPGDLSRVGAACLRHISTIASRFDTPQWTIFEKAIWDASVVTLHPIRLLTAQFICDNDDGGKLRTDGTGPLPPKIRMMAQQIFQVDSQRSVSENGNCEEEENGDIDLIFEEGGLRVRIPVSIVISSLLSHQLLLQLIANILSPAKVSPLMRKVLIAGSNEELLGKLSKRTIARLFYSLDASFQTARDVDARPGVGLLITKTTGLNHPNLFKQLVSSGLIKLHTLFQLFKLTGDVQPMKKLCLCMERIVSELQRLEKKAGMEKLAVLQREYKEESLEFMLVEEDGERLYKVVTQKQIDSALTDYQRQKPLGTQPTKERKNPFTETLSNHDNGATENGQLDDNALRLISFRELCLIPVHLSLAESDPKALLNPLLPAVKRLLLASPDLSVRSLAIQLLDLYTS